MKVDQNPNRKSKSNEIFNSYYPALILWLG